LSSIHPNLEVYLELADPVIITNQYYQIVAANKAFENVTGYSKEFAYGRNPKFLRSNLTENEVYVKLKKNLQKGKPWSGVFINQKKSGDIWHSSITITPIYINHEVYYVGIFRELEQLKEGSYVPKAETRKMKREILKVLAISCEIRDPELKVI